MTYNGLPIYEMVLEEDIDRMLAISIVDDPAVESNFLMFKNDKKPLMFQASDGMEHIVTGVAIRAGMPIYRYDAFTGIEYYVVFTKEVIKQIVEKYSKENKWNTVDLQHDGVPVEGVYMVETYIKDIERGINPKGFEDIEDGSLFVTFKIEDESLWNEIKTSGEFNGFSIEIYASMIPAENFTNEETVDSLVEQALSDKKKVDFATTDQLNKLMKDEQVADIGLEDKRTLSNAQVQSLGKQNGMRVAIIQADDAYGNKAWYIEPVKSIKTIQPVTTPWQPFDYNAPSYNVVNEIIDEITVDKTHATASNDMESLIKDRKWVMINYNDELENPHTGARQCMVVAWGLTKLGNECLRIYERYGDSRSADEGYGFIPDYRLILTKRIINLRPIDYLEPWTEADLDSRYNWSGDRSMNSVFYWYH